MTLVGAAGRQQPLVLQAGDHVGKLAVAVNVQAAGVKRLVARGQDDRADVEGDYFLFIVEVDGPGGTEFFAGLAFALGEVKAVFLVNDVLQGHRLAVGDVDGLPLAHPHVVFVVHFFGAFLGTQAAGDALVHVHIARLFPDGDLKVALLSGNLFDFGEGEKLDV